MAISDEPSLEQIADLVGHAQPKVYSDQLRPVLLAGTVAMDNVFGKGELPTAA